MTIPCPKCKYPVQVLDPSKEENMLRLVASIHNSRRKVRGGGRPVGCRRCARCGKFHKKEDKCKA